MFLPVPSTSGRNIIPGEIAARLQSDFGGEVLSNAAAPTAKYEAKSTKGIRKLENPAGYKFTKPVAHLQGKNVVIVDDFHSTGETGRAMRDALAEGGVTTAKEAYLAGKQMTPANSRQIDAVTNDLVRLTGCRKEEVRPKLVQYFGQRGTELLNQVANDLQSKDNRRAKRDVDQRTPKERANALLNFLRR